MRVTAIVSERIDLAVALACCVLIAGCGGSSLPDFGEPVALDVPAAAGSLGPRITNGSGQILLSWMEPQAEGAILRVSELGEQGWGPAITVVSDERMVVNWADLPAVLSVATGAKNNSQWAAHWLSYNADNQGFAYDVRFSRSTDSGATWSTHMTPHTDGTPTEHGFVSKFRSPRGTGLLWLDGRKTVVANKDAPSPVENGMTLRYAVVGPAGELIDEVLVDELVCDCCPTSVAVSSSGPLAVYRNRTEDEVRDIYITRFNNGQWTPGVAVADDGWIVDGCPVNGPVIAASGDLVGVAWFTAAGNRARVQASVSRDGGKTFQPPVVVASGTLSGYVDIVFVGSSAFVVSWVERSQAGSEIRVQALAADGAPGTAFTIGRSRTAMNVAQMEYRQGELIMAWTDQAGDSGGGDSAGAGSTVVSARVPVRFDR